MEKNVSVMESRSNMSLPPLVGNTSEDLSSIYEDRVAMINRHILWYRKKKKGKQLWSRVIRTAALLLAAIGGICPLLYGDVAAEARQWGYPILAASGSLLIFDKMMGFSTSWMRFMEAAILLEARAEAFKTAWLRALNSAQEGEGRSTEKMFELVEQLNSDIYQIVHAETAKWLTEFRSNDLDSILPSHMRFPGSRREKNERRED